ncbi:phage tail protein [Clostridium aquiflavi]|uniref:Phage tail protein n=1 Tax=Clostridium aquiflavi TaxID=3073603 RepID=A0ABU1EDZ6_9CLOT|nr:phage tail protein [Clostridium sp. 5N-1]MDR5586609.1 phage tail protein [Clostridium sp. 5N-1]
MSEKFYTILTNIGKSKIANFAINGEEVKFVKLKVGDGNGKYYNPIENQKDLINTVWEGKIGNIQIDKDNPNWIVLEAIIPPEVGDFTIREYGAFDEEDNLLAISKCPETYKPTISNGSTKELIIKMILSVSNTESISFEVDPNIMLAKNSKVDEIDKKVNHTISKLKDMGKNLSQLSNPNLLINGGFNVNQRGKDSYTATGGSFYSLDRWVSYNLTDDTTQVLPQASGVIVKSTNGGAGRYRQWVELQKTTLYLNTPLTFSVKINNPCTKCSMIIINKNNGILASKEFSNVSANSVLSLTYALSSDVTDIIGVQISTRDSNGIYLKYAKLELGSVATPFVPRPYSEELALCWRYFRKLNMDGIAVLTDPSTVVLHLGGNVPMRVNPSVSFSTTAYLHTNGETSAINITNATFNGDSGQTLYAGISGVPGGKYGTINASSAANDFVSGAVWLYLDSEIY